MGHATAGLGVAVIAGCLALRLRRALTQRRRHEEAAELLDLLRLEALQPGTVLLKIHAIQWTARSGQRVGAVDALTGAVSDQWLPGPPDPPGTLIILRRLSGRPTDVIVRMTASSLEAANRHRGMNVDPSAAIGHPVVAAAERLLRDR